MSEYGSTSASALAVQTKEGFNNESYVTGSLAMAAKGGLTGSPTY